MRIDIDREAIARAVRYIDNCCHCGMASEEDVEKLIDAMLAAMHCARAWELGDGRLLDENNRSLVAAEGLDEMCDQAAGLVCKALGLDDAAIAAQARQLMERQP